MGEGGVMPYKDPAARRAYDAERARLFVRAHPQEVAARSRRYYLANTEKCRERSRLYREKHKDHCRANWQAYREANRERRNAYQREYNKTRGKEVSRAYWARHHPNASKRRSGEPGISPQESRRRWNARNSDYTREYQRENFLSVNGHRINLNTMPPELKELGLLIKRTRQLIKTNRRGVTQ